MDFWNWVGGLIRIRFTGADVAGVLSAVSRAGLTIFDGEILDEMNAVITVKRSEYKQINRILEASGYSVEIVERKGAYWSLKRLLKRPILTVGILILLVLNSYLPGRILFIQVEGNSGVPTRQILEVAGKCGLQFGTVRREIRSEKIKNKLLEAIPQLQWIGVNTRGCVAVISVKERQITQEKSTEKTVSSIVAGRDGVVMACTVTQGNPVCKVGQAVKAGEVLISGYTDCGLKIQATKAEGEVYAKTDRMLTMLFPRNWHQNRYTNQQISKYSLIIGKKRINLYNDSGISYPSCGKMYKEIYLTLPGGFVLPVCFAIETWIAVDSHVAQFDPEQAKEKLTTYAARYLSEQMIAGRVLTFDEVFVDFDSEYQMEGKYACLEMIGQERKEEVYGKYD